MPGTVRYQNARVHSGVAAVGTALLVRGGRVLAVGSEAAAADADRIVDLGGALVTPAFVDAHVHATSTGLALAGLDLHACASLAEVLDAVGAAARERPAGTLLGTGWDETTWPQRRPPTAAELDRAGAGRAVYLSRVDKHSAVASSALLAAVPALPGLPGYSADGWVRIDAHDAVRVAAFASLGAAARREAQRATLRHAAALGIAQVHEMAGPVISGADDLLELRQLAAAEPAPAVVPYWAELLGVDTARELGAIGAAGDLFCDGSLGSHTAALGEPYADRPDTAGELRHPTADIEEHVVRCVRAGLQAGFHAIGDAAVDQVVDAVERATRRLGRPAGTGSRIEHAEYVRDPARLAASGLVASVQPRFDELWGGRTGMYAQRLGADRAARLNRFADLAAAGVPLAFGSDSPVTELGAWAAVRAAVRPHEASTGLPVLAAFAAHTAGGHRAAGQDGGRLVAGGEATFAVWRADGVGADGLPDLAPGEPLPVCLATVRSGVPIFVGAELAAGGDLPTPG